MKKKRIIKFICLTITLTFLYSYIIEESGYYEYNLNNKKNLTEKQIKKFEQDIKDGKEIDLKKYLKKNTIDYSNNLTKKTSNISIKLNNYLKIILNDSINIFEKLIK